MCAYFSAKQCFKDNITNSNIKVKERLVKSLYINIKVTRLERSHLKGFISFSKIFHDHFSQNKIQVAPKFF